MIPPTCDGCGALITGAIVRGHVVECVACANGNSESATVAAIAAWLRSHGWTRQADAVERGEWKR